MERGRPRPQQGAPGLSIRELQWIQRHRRGVSSPGCVIATENSRDQASH